MTSEEVGHAPFGCERPTGQDRTGIGRHIPIPYILYILYVSEFLVEVPSGDSINYKALIENLIRESKSKTP